MWCGFDYIILATNYTACPAYAGDLHELNFMDLQFGFRIFGPLIKYSQRLINNIHEYVHPAIWRGFTHSC